ncbi:hypothetical protein BDZ94DRAFT_1273638 [Collybia nuda]|uniref:Uncharacterized protein n=1 Tax=Collybia nuda TaxID=64659 RepID=A0A9P6CDQ5_9AGAR|nr:hypothetical protein BDZ94DRAFT_1273638 [Collybia nuda]
MNRIPRASAGLDLRPLMRGSCHAKAQYASNLLGVRLMLVIFLSRAHWVPAFLSTGEGSLSVGCGARSIEIPIKDRRTY